MKKFIYILIIIASSMNGCSQEKLFELASKTDLELIFAVASDGTTSGTGLIISDGDIYCEGFEASSIPSSSSYMVTATDYSGVFVGVSSMIYYTDDPRNSGWSMTTISGALDLKSRGGNAWLITQSSPYFYQFMDKMWNTTSSSVSFSAGDIPLKLCFTRENYKLYLLTSASSSFMIYDLDSIGIFSSPAIISTPYTMMAPVTGNPTYFAAAGGQFYVGTSSSFLMKNTADNTMITVTPTVTGMSYAVVDTSDIFAVSGSPLTIYRLISTSGTYAFTQEYSISTESGTVFVSPLATGKIVIGINGSTSANGLYVYNYSTGQLRTFSTNSIFGLYVKPPK
jgi:hypothetical protein